MTWGRYETVELDRFISGPTVAPVRSSRSELWSPRWGGKARRPSLGAIIAWTTLAAVSLPACGVSTATSSPTAATGHPSAILQAALVAWSNFPSAAPRRPVVLLYGDKVNAPAQGFSDDALKEAFLDGAIAGPDSLPSGPTSSDGVDLITSQQAITILTVPSGSGPQATLTIQVTKVALGTDTFQTDRGMLPLPAWQFRMQGVQNPASVLAISPIEEFTPPQPSNRPQVVGAGTIGRDQRTLLLTFAGPPAGTGPCEANFVASSAESASAVAVSLRSITSPKYKNVACTQMAVDRHLTIALLTPLRNRVVIDASSLMAVLVTKVSG